VNVEQLLALAIATAEDGMRAGELPIGAIVVLGNEVIARAYTQERTRNSRLVHAELLALTEADRVLGLRRPSAVLRLATTLEPCLMCLGAAMSLGVAEVCYGLESPGDGAAHLAQTWRSANADLPWYRLPTLTGGIRRSECRDQFRRYCATAPESGMLRWATNLADLPD